MAEQKTKRYLELQMEELKAAHADNIAQNPTEKKINPNHNAKNAAIAEMYNDAAEYETDLKAFEDELFLVNKHSFKDMADEMHKAFPKEKDRDFLAELNTIIELGWTDLVEVQKTHPQEQLDLIKATDFTEMIEVFNAMFPEYEGDFEAEARALLNQRWERLINIKKEHIKQELYEINTSGLKAKYVKRVYQKYHGLV
ncbi:hypothetical protein JHD47_08105 [Sulfurimonas sp. SAG-AH-194-L11]|nr:hypothetical protein [Sulfurimonas sp. SAG-AH-194-L11]MDF1877777.1 hypothetical protein [Sulfurimonas sp. SAG-AH-194-L11]